MKVGHLSYTMTRGLLWDRLVIVKNRRTHRVFKPTEAKCNLALENDVVYEVPVEITSEGGIYLKVLPEDTFDISVGTHDFDILCPVRGYWTVVAKGTLVVEDLVLVDDLPENV